MPYVERNRDGQVTGLYNRPQPDRAVELLADDHPDVVAFRDRAGEPQVTDRDRVYALAERLGVDPADVEQDAADRTR